MSEPAASYPAPLGRGSRVALARASCRLSGLIACALVATACDSPVDTSTPPDILGVSLRTVPAPLVREMAVTVTRAYGVSVDYWSVGGPRLRVTSEDAVGSHELLLARLRPGTTYQYEVRSSGAAGQGEAATGSFTTDPLPDGLASLVFTTEGTPTEPLTMLEITAHGGGHRGVVITDADGAVVWYLDDGPVAGADRRANGNFIFQYGAVGVLEVTPSGFPVAGVPQQPLPERRIHHDAIVTPWNTVLFIAYDTREHDGRAISGEAIWEWDPDTDELVQRWSSWDHMSPDTDWGPQAFDEDWLHANALSIGPAGNVLMSLRWTDQVISISPDFSEIEWRLGGINADVEVIGSDVFIGQHTASELEPVNGRRRVLLFDNGPQGRGFSRAQELELDLEAGTATTVWEFRPEPDNFSFITSLARRMSNGNTFVAFGAGPGVLASFGPVEAFEVRPSGAVQFHLTIGGPTVNNSFVLFRASPLSDIAGEQVVVP